jgi:uncharacterized membrane protein YhiD involved in acid resistance
MSSRALGFIASIFAIGMGACLFTLILSWIMGIALSHDDMYSYIFGAVVGLAGFVACTAIFWARRQDGTP